MYWRIRWRHAAALKLRHIPWREAARIDKSVLWFADTGEGDIEWVKGSRADDRLLVPGYSILLEVHAEAQILEVWAIARRDR